MKILRYLIVSCIFAQFVCATAKAASADGENRLTAGIPGKGDLTLDQVNQWLKDPARHEKINLTLPEGLAVGKDAVYVPDDNPITHAKVELGRQLYFDRRLSKGNEVSCADCHHPDSGYGFNTQFGVGIQGQTGGRNSPTSMNRILSREQFWDGRAKDLEAQAVGPIANPIEMGNTHEAVVAFLKSNAVYRAQFVKIFGRDPHIDDVGRAIATFERVIVTGDSPYDYNDRLERLKEFVRTEGFESLDEVKKEDPDLYARYTATQKAAEANPMSDSAKRGQKLFFSKEANCAACHVGANFTDEKYHNLGVGMDAEKPDLGRFAETGKEEDKGAFKTPTLRNVAQNGPYMHDGSQKTLLEVVQWYVKGGHPNPHLSDKIKAFKASEQDMLDLVAFMEALTGPLPKVEMQRLPVE